MPQSRGESGGMGRWNEKANVAEYLYGLQETKSRTCEPSEMEIGHGEE